MKKFLSSAALSLSVLASSHAADTANIDFRTNINPALLYFQAFQNMPQLSEEDSKHLFDHPNAWPGPFDDRALDLMKRYDPSFKLLHRARFSKIPCDWGYDLSDGPYALLPGLAPAKRLTQAARYRAMAALEAHDFPAARDDLAAAFALGRNLATDRILISALVQFAIENIVSSVIAENFYRFTPDQLDQLLAAFDSAPRRGGIVDTIPTEDNAFYKFILRHVEKMIADSNNNNDLFWQQFEAFWNPIASEPGKDPEPTAAEVRQAAQNSIAGLRTLLDEMPGYYLETARMMSLPYPEYKNQFPNFFARIEASPNPLIKQFFTIFKNIRAKELRTIVRHEMVRAAAAYKRGGIDAFRTVHDPLIGGPFEFTRAHFEGFDRGFQIKSKERFSDFDEVMIFLEKPGKPFRLDGKNAGTAP